MPERKPAKAGFFVALDMNEYALYILAGTNVLLAAIIARHSNIMQELTPMIKSVFEKLKDIDCEETVADDKEFQSQKPED